MVEDFQKIKKKLEGIGRSAGKLLTSKGKRTILKKPKTKLPSTDPEKFISRGLGNRALVRKGRTGYFNEDTIGESKWL